MHLTNQYRLLLTLLIGSLCTSALRSQEAFVIPLLEQAPSIDGDLSDWKSEAFSSGVWNLDRVKQTSWYQPKRNKLTIHAGEDPKELDLEATYFMAIHGNDLYLGAEVKDNVNDVEEAKHSPKRWYYKDAIAWFVEAPSDTVPEKFEKGDHGFAFILDENRPDYGAWWRHGSDEQAYVEEAFPEELVDYQFKMNPWSRSDADYILEVRIDMAKTLAADWNREEAIRMMIVHCDPDGEEYGGHLLIYGQGDNDASWQTFELEQTKTDE